nr:hypothetical protein [Rickettsia endosymbiont of Ceutorhynchus assimilis]
MDTVLALMLMLHSVPEKGLVGHFAALPIDLIQAFMYLIIANAMEAFVTISETMAQALFSSGWGVAGSVWSSCHKRITKLYCQLLALIITPRYDTEH